MPEMEKGRPPENKRSRKPAHPVKREINQEMKVRVKPGLYPAPLRALRRRVNVRKSVLKITTLFVFNECSLCGFCVTSSHQKKALSFLSGSKIIRINFFQTSQMKF